MQPETELTVIMADAAQDFDIDIMLIGAHARNYWIEQCGIKQPVRATMDIDFACQVMVWDDYQKLIEHLQNKFSLRPDQSEKHKLWLRDKLPVDLIPFGGIADKNGEIHWPPEFETSLCVLGYDAAKNDAAIIDVEGRSVKIIKPHWFVLLKLQAFAGDPTRSKDLTDLFFLIDNYFELVDMEKRVYSDHGIDADIMKMNDFDVRVAAAVLGGRDCLRANHQTAQKIMGKLSDYNKNDSLSIAFATAAKIDLPLSKRILGGLLGGF